MPLRVSRSVGALLLAAGLVLVLGMEAALSQQNLPKLQPGVTDPGKQAVQLQELQAALSGYKPAAVALPGQAPASQFNGNATSLLLQMKQAGMAPAMVDRFLAAGGHFTLVEGDPGKGNQAVYRPGTTSIVVAASQINDGVLRANLGPAALANIAHEFWHAYKDQVVDKGYDPDTRAQFDALKDWLLTQNATAPDGTGVALSSVVKDIDDFADEYAADVFTRVFSTGPYVAGNKDPEALVKAITGITSDTYYGYQNDNRTVYLVTGQVPDGIMDQLLRLGIAPAGLTPKKPQVDVPPDKFPQYNPVGDLVEPALDLPPLPTLPARFCSFEERLDFDNNLLKPAFARVRATFLAVGKYWSDINERRRMSKYDLEAKTKEAAEVSGSIRPTLLEELDRRVKYADAVIARYQPIYTAVSKRYENDTGPATRVVDVVDCQQPMFVEISYPTLPEPICTEAEREAALALLTPVVDEARAGAGRFNDWWRELVVRSQNSTGKATKDRLTAQAKQAQESAASAQKVSDELSTYLSELKARPLACMDPCLVGSWKGKDMLVTFDKAGAQTVVYDDAHPEGVPTVTWSGVGLNVITAAKGVAKVKESKPGTVVYRVEKSPPLPLGNLIGYGGLGVLDGDNAYTCTETALSYQGSTRADRKPNFAVALSKAP